MSVYVDDLRKLESKPRIWPGSYACHMMADTPQELHAMANRIALSLSWFQGDHYDLTKSKREEAVEAGAVEVSNRILVALRRKLREANDGRQR